MTTDNGTTFDHWCVLELMGHVRLAGRVTEESLFGTALGRIDIPNTDGFTTQYFGGSSVYRITPTTEEIARPAPCATSLSRSTVGSCPRRRCRRRSADAATGLGQDDDGYNDLDEGDYGSD